jgi:pimeloyl-ACP methyl ester carboxylesterase
MTGSLATTTLTAPGAMPERAILFLHGILGTRGNWRTVARRFVERRPEWAAVLVDLREHGESRDLGGTSSLTAAVADLDGVVATAAAPVHGVLGHSFGGKVALAWVAARGGALDDAWIVDSNPGARPDRRGSEDTVAVVRLLRELRGAYATREAFVSALVARGRDEAFARWLAMSLRPRDGALAFDLDLDAIERMLDEHFSLDLWPLVEAPPGRVRLHFVVAGRSTVLDGTDRARLDAIAARIPERVTVTHADDAGHWVHVDAPDALVSALVAQAC